MKKRGKASVESTIVVNGSRFKKNLSRFLRKRFEENSEKQIDKILEALARPEAETLTVRYTLELDKSALDLIRELSK
jgi:hypothetical protein